MPNVLHNALTSADLHPPGAHTHPDSDLSSHVQLDARYYQRALVDAALAGKQDDLLHEAHRYTRRIAADAISPRFQIPKDSLPIYGFPTRISPEHQAEPGRTLGRWGDDAWGDRAALGKRNGVFDNDLIEAAASFISLRWRPSFSPTWVTGVPTRRYPHLVPELARKLAGLLALPYVDAIAKIRDTAQQNAQENSVHQCRNLDGSFEIVGVPNAGPVLLVDDLVDSGWSFTILAMLLRRAGSGPVLPFALATTRARDD